jgi:hypothetical protein
MHGGGHSETAARAPKSTPFILVPLRPLPKERSPRRWDRGEASGAGMPRLRVRALGAAAGRTYRGSAE